MTAPTLRPYQRDQLDSIVSALKAGTNRVLVKSPTGTGKTVTFAAMLQWPGMKAWLDSLPASRGATMLVIAHREELLDQAAAKIQAANPGLMVSVEQADRHANRYSDVVIASIQTLASRKFQRLLDLLRWHQPRVVIIDEAHHAAAPTYRTALVHLGFLPGAPGLDDAGNIEAPDFDDVAKMEAALKGWDAVAPKDRVLVGVTATPNRSDAIGLGCVFQTIAYSYALKQAVSDGWLVPIKPWVIETKTSLEDVRISRGEFNQKDLAEAVNTERRNQLAVAAWQAHAENLPTLAFTVDVAHAHALADEFQRQGYRARAVSGETPKEDRRQILRDYTEGQIDVVTNCMVLTEGTDLPLTRCILHAKPTKSATLYEQMTGRGLRLYPGKEECVVIDLVDVARRHSLQAAPVLYGLPPGLKTKGDDLRATESAFEDLRAKNPDFDIDAALAGARLSLDELNAQASTFNIWTVPPMGAYGDAVSMNWTRIGDTSFRLQYPWQDGTEILMVEQDVLGHFDVVATMRPAGGGSVRQRTLSTGILTAAEALHVAEAFVQSDRRTVARLTDRSAPWRDKPASDKQLGLLRKLKVPHNPKSLTSGGASDLINLAKARSGR